MQLGTPEEIVDCQNISTIGSNRQVTGCKTYGSDRVGSGHVSKVRDTLHFCNEMTYSAKPLPTLSETVVKQDETVSSGGIALII